MSIKFLVLGGGYFGLGGGSADFYFHGRVDFSDSSTVTIFFLGQKSLLWSRMSGRRMSGTSRRFPRHIFLSCAFP